MARASTTAIEPTDVGTRSLRVSDQIWEQARNRAAHEHLKVSRAVAILVEAYARGVIDLPRVTITYEAN